MYIQGVNYDLGRMIRERGVDWFQGEIMGTLMESREGAAPALTPDDFSIRELYEAVDSTDFDVLTGNLVTRAIMDSYQDAALVGDQLVTRMPSSKEVDLIPTLTHTSKSEHVPEGTEYPTTAKMEDGYVEVRGKKFGQILDITEEAIMFDNTNAILREARKIGEDAAQEREVQILSTIQDLAGFQYFRPNGTQVNLYQTAQGAGDPHQFGNLINNVLADHTDLDAALQTFAAIRNANGRPVVVKPTTLLVPSALAMTAAEILGAATKLGQANPALKNPAKGLVNAVGTPYLDMTSTTNWFLGDFKKQFVWKEVIPMQVRTRKGDTDAAWKRDIKASYKVRWYGQCAPTDYVYVVKSTGTV